MKRKAALAAMAARRPKPDEEDPADVAAVLDATKNMGDYKLKSSPDYEVRHRVYWLIAMDTLWCRRQVCVWYLWLGVAAVLLWAL